MQKTSIFQQAIEQAETELAITENGDKLNMIASDLNALETQTNGLKNLASTVQKSLEVSMVESNKAKDQALNLQKSIANLQNTLNTLEVQELHQVITTLQNMPNELKEQMPAVKEEIILILQVMTAPVASLSQEMISLKDEYKSIQNQLRIMSQETQDLNYKTQLMQKQQSITNLPQIVFISIGITMLPVAGFLLLMVAAITGNWLVVVFCLIVFFALSALAVFLAVKQGFITKFWKEQEQ